MERERLVNIPTAAVLTRSASLRADSGGGSSIAELAQSIAGLGIIEPIVVREAGNCRYEVIAGERRLLAARALKVEFVPCLVRDCTDSVALLTALTENLQRRDLSPMERASVVKRLMEEFDLRQGEISRCIGMSQSGIAHHLRLLSLPAEVRDHIHNGALSMGHGKLLAGIEEPARAIALATDCISRNWSVRELEEFLSTTRPALRGRRTERTAITRREMELPNGVFLTIKADTGDTSGTIEIPFYSATEKEWVLEALAGGRAGLRRPSGRRRGAGGTARASRPSV